MKNGKENNRDRKRKIKKKNKKEALEPAQISTTAISPIKDVREKEKEKIHIKLSSCSKNGFIHHCKTRQDATLW